MSRHQTPPKANPPKRVRTARRVVVTAVVAAVVILLLVVPSLLLGRASLAWGTRMIAQTRIRQGAIGAAQHWLAWSAWFAPDDGAIDLIRAAAFRRLSQQDRWSEALQQAARKGAPALQVAQEAKLGRIQDGDVPEDVAAELAAMIAAGVPPHDFHTALVHGYLARKDPRGAKAALAAWEADHPDEVHLPYARGNYWLWVSKDEPNIIRRREFIEWTEREFESVLARQPRHELARIALAEFFEDQSRLEEALGQYAALLTRALPDEAVTLKLAKLLRRLNRLNDARTVLDSLSPPLRSSAEFAAQMADLELESGAYHEADRWLVQSRLDAPVRGGILVAAAVSAAVQEQPLRAQQLFTRLDAMHNYNVRMEDLRARVATGADDPQAEDALRRLRAAPPDDRPAGTGQTAADRAEDLEASGSGLYALHCSACHGENGDGSGRAARHLFPKPRDLRTGRFRLVSTVNAIPSLEDLEASIRRGMTGTSMRAFDNLSDEQRMLLAREVRRLNRVGRGEQYIDTLLQEGADVDENEVRDVVRLGTTPADAAWIPRIRLGDSQAIVRGAEAYLQLGCKNCHGKDGMGVSDVPLFDERGHPAPARDLVHDAFKGGHEPEAVYLRILLGMPGTPHPACPAVADDQRIDLIHYCLSLSREPKRIGSNHQRALQAWTPQVR